MKLIQFQHGHDKKVGIVKEQDVYPISTIIERYNDVHSEKLHLQDDMRSIIENKQSFNEVKNWFDKNFDQVGSEKKDINELNLLAPLTNPGKVVCVGNNYMDHCIEQNVEPPKKPMIFSKWPSCIIAEGESIELPDDSEQVDYEAELVVVIGEGGKDISEEQALDHVFGYTIMNDVSARDVQFEDVQWVRGKSYDTFAPLGPVIVTKDEIDDPHHLDIKLEVNGQVLQDSNTKHLIFKIPYIISYLSQGFKFEPGDIIATGTPHGVGVFRDPQVFLKPGDDCKIEIESIGVLENPVKQA